MWTLRVDTCVEKVQLVSEMRSEKLKKRQADTIIEDIPNNHLLASSYLRRVFICIRLNTFLCPSRCFEIGGISMLIFIHLMKPDLNALPKDCSL